MKIAISRRNGLGDFVCATLPLYYRLREIAPSAEIHFFMDDRNGEIYRYYIEDETLFHSFYSAKNNYISIFKTAASLRNLSFDIGITPPPSYNKLNGLFLKLLGCKTILGRTESTQRNFWEGILFSKPYGCTVPDFNKHVALHSLQCIEPNWTEIPISLYPKALKHRIAPFTFSIKNNNPKLLVEVSNNRSSSQLNPIKLANILNSLNNSITFTPIISAKKTDINKAMELQQRLVMPSEIALTPTTSNFMSLINGIDYFMVGDGGIAHIAGSLDKPGLALYGETSLNRWQVLSRDVHHLFNSTDVNLIDSGLILENMTEILHKNINKHKK